MEQQTVPSPESLQTLGRMVEGSRLAQLVHIAATLGIADLLADGPKSGDELAQATGTHAPSLYRALRGLASAGVFAELEGRRFALTPVGAGLRSDVPGSWRTMAILYAREPYRAWADALLTVRTGETAFNRMFGKGWFDYVADNAEAAAVFNEAMTGRSAQRNAALLAAYDFAQFGTVVDVGGGHGRLLTAILKAHPSVRGVLFDLPAVIDGARQLVAAEGVAGRCELVGGDFFQAVPAGGDAYLLSTVIHDWEDAEAITILQSCRRVMAPTAKLLLVELALPAANVPSGEPFMHPAYSGDLNMMVVVGGRERTEAEFRQLFRQAGFELTQVVPLLAGSCVIEAVPV